MKGYGWTVSSRAHFSNLCFTNLSRPVSISGRLWRRKPETNVEKDRPGASEHEGENGTGSSVTWFNTLSPIHSTRARSAQIRLIKALYFLPLRASLLYRSRQMQAHASSFYIHRASVNGGDCGRKKSERRADNPQDR